MAELLRALSGVLCLFAVLINGLGTAVRRGSGLIHVSGVLVNGPAGVNGLRLGIVELGLPVLDTVARLLVGLFALLNDLGQICDDLTLFFQLFIGGVAGLLHFFQLGLGVLQLLFVVF